MHIDTYTYAVAVWYNIHVHTHTYRCGQCIYQLATHIMFLYDSKHRVPVRQRTRSDDDLFGRQSMSMSDDDVKIQRRASTIEMEL